MKNSTLQHHCPKKSMFPHNKLTPAEMNDYKYIQINN